MLYLIVLMNSKLFPILQCDDNNAGKIWENKLDVKIALIFIKLKRQKLINTNRVIIFFFFNVDKVCF